MGGLFTNELISAGDLCDKGCEDGGLTRFGTGELFLPAEPLPPSKSYTFYSSRGKSAAPGEKLPFAFLSGDPLPVEKNVVTLPPGVVFCVYSFQCHTENNVDFVEITPFLNGCAFPGGALKAARTISGLHSAVTASAVFSSDGNAELFFVPCTEEGVSIDEIVFTALLVYDA